MMCAGCAIGIPEGVHLCPGCFANADRAMTAATEDMEAAIRDGRPRDALFQGLEVCLRSWDWLRFHDAELSSDDDGEPGGDDAPADLGTLLMLDDEVRLLASASLFALRQPRWIPSLWGLPLSQVAPAQSLFLDPDLSIAWLSHKWLVMHDPRETPIAKKGAESLLKMALIQFHSLTSSTAAWCWRALLSDQKPEWFFKDQTAARIYILAHECKPRQQWLPSDDQDMARALSRLGLPAQPQAEKLPVYLIQLRVLLHVDAAGLEV